MRRRHLIELEDQAWCPAAVRHGITDLLQLVLGLSNCYTAILPRLASALERSGERDILDLCSGSGGPWRRLLPYFSEAQLRHVRFTDKYPNAAASRGLVANSKGRILIEQESVVQMGPAPSRPPPTTPTKRLGRDFRFPERPGEPKSE